MTYCENMSRTIREEGGPGESSYGKVWSKISDRAVRNFEYEGFINGPGVL